MSQENHIIGKHIESIQSPEHVRYSTLGQGVVGFAFLTDGTEPYVLLNLVNRLAGAGVINNPVDEGQIIAGIISNEEQLNLILQIQQETNFNLGLGLPMLVRRSRRSHDHETQIEPETVRVILDKDNNFIDFGGSTITAAVRALQQSLKTGGKILIRRLNPESTIEEVKSTKVDLLTFYELREHLRTYSAAEKPEVREIAKVPLSYDFNPVLFSGQVVEIDVEHSTGLVQKPEWDKRIHKNLYLFFKDLEDTFRETPGLYLGILKTTESIIMYARDPILLNKIKKFIEENTSIRGISVHFKIFPVENAILYVKDDKTVIFSSKPINRKEQPSSAAEITNGI